MSKPRSREFLHRCAQMPEFDEATGGSLRNNIRMGDREAVLRFCAFRLHDVEDYRVAESMDAFLLNTTHELDSPAQVDDAKLAALQDELRRAMSNAVTVFGHSTFAV